MNRRLYLLPGISILAIIFVHSTTWSLNALLWWNHRYQNLLPENFNPYHTFDFFFVTSLKFLFLFGVPVFFFISGNFVDYLFKSNDKNIIWKNIIKRVTSLLIPYFVWSTILLFFKRITGDVNYSPIEFVFYYLLGIDGYWFIPALIIYYLLSPWMYKLAKDNWRVLLASVLIIQFLPIVLKMFWIDQNPALASQRVFTLILFQSFINRALYFPLGIVFCLRKPDFERILHKYRWLMVSMAIASILYLSFYNAWLKYQIPPQHWLSYAEFPIEQVYALSLIGLYIGVDNFKIPFTKQLLQFGGLTLGIYFLHFFFISSFSRAAYHFLPLIMRFQMVFLPIVFIVGLVGSILVIKVVKQSPVKRIYPYLFG